MRDEDRVQAAIGRAVGLVDPPEPRLERVVGRARRLRRRRVVAGVVASALVLSGIGVPLGLLAGLGGNHSVPGSGRLDAFGIQVTLPEGWEGRISWTTDEVGPVLQAGTFPLPKLGDDFLRRAMNAMGPDDVVLTLHEFTPSCPCTGFHDASLPVQTGPADEVSDAGFDPGHAYDERAFVADDRWFVLGVAFGTDPAGAAAAHQASDVLSTLSIDGGLTSGPTGEPPGGPVPIPRFDPAPGWNTLRAVPPTWASTEPFTAHDLENVARYDIVQYRPGSTLLRLPPEGVVIIASFAFPSEARQVGSPNFPDRTLPLTLADSRGCGAWEGQVSATVPECVILARVDGQDVDVRVYFGNQNPSDAARAAADTELARLHFPGAETSPSAPPPLTSGTSELDRDEGISLLVPDGWSYVQDPSGPTEPRTVLAISNVPIPLGGECAPSAAVDALPPQGVLAWVILYGDTQGNAFPPRPAAFSLDPSTLAPYECSGVPSFMFRFSDQGRDFQVHVVLGPKASEADRDMLLASLSSMVVDRCPPAESPPPTSSFGILAPAREAAGQPVQFQGPTGRGEDWFWSPLDRIEVWWSKDPLGAPGGGNALLLGTVHPGTACSFSVSFVVPNVAPGDYLITALGYDAGGSGVMAERRFVVTP
jgi:hypothetical protein